MSKKGRYGRPGPGNLLAAVLLNAVVAYILLTFILKVFGPDIIVPVEWLVGAMLPGAAIAYGCLWYWLILVGLTRGVTWGEVCKYGVLIALADVPICGMVIGALLEGAPLSGLIIGLFMLITVPTLTVGMSIFGVTMGLFNGWMVTNWIEQRK